MHALATLLLYLLNVVLLGAFVRFSKHGAALLAGKQDDLLLTGLRGIAAFVVLVAHTLTFTSNVVTQHFFASIGVVIFFMLTGFLFFSMVLRGSIDFGSYFSKRIRRLVPGAFVAITLIQFCDWIEAGTPLIGRGKAVAILRNYAFGFVGDLYGVTGVYDIAAIVRKLGMIWTLKFEWLFYLSFPLIVTICGRSIVRVFLAVAVVGLVFVNPPMLISGDTESSHFFSFFIGALAAWSVHRFPAKSVWPSALVIAAWAVGVVFYLLRVDPEHLGSGRVSFQLVAGVMFIFVVRLGQTKPAWLSWLTSLSGVQALGTISYSLYLYHMAVIYYGVAAAKRWFEGDTAALAALLPISLVTVLISSLSYYFVERRFLVSRPQLQR